MKYTYYMYNQLCICDKSFGKLQKLKGGMYLTFLSRLKIQYFPGCLLNLTENVLHKLVK